MITGASRGIGLEVAGAALAAGEQVTATGRDVDGLAEALDSDGVRLTCLPLDVRDRAQIAETVVAVAEAMGSIEVLRGGIGRRIRGVVRDQRVRGRERASSGAATDAPGPQ